MRAPVFLLLLLPAMAAAAPAPPAPPVEELVAIALERSPAVAARRAGMAAAREMERPARALPDPMVEGMLQNAGFPDYTVGEEPMSMVGIEVRQPLPYPGKLRARGEAAAAETAVRAAELAETASRVAAEVRSLYARIYALDRERQALTTSHELVELLSATAQARYASGGAEQESLIRAQLEGSRLGEELDDLEAERAVMVAELNRRLDRPGDAPLGEVAELPAVTSPAAEWAEWQEAVVQASPAVQVARAAVAAAERRLAVSRLDLKPDFSPSAGIASQGSMGNVVTLRFGVELPFRKAQRQEPMIRAAEHELEAARRMQADAEAMARAEAARVEARWRQADRQIVRFREAILPQTSVGLDAARASYLAGRGDFSTVVENFRMWIDSRVQLARREADRFAAWAETERLAPHPPAPSPQPGIGINLSSDIGRGLPPPGREEGWSRGRTKEGAAPVKASRWFEAVEATPLLASPLLQPPPAQGRGTHLPSRRKPTLARMPLPGEGETSIVKGAQP